MILKSYCKLNIQVSNFSDQFTGNKISSLHDCLLFTGCLLSLLSCPDKNKHGKKDKKMIILSYGFSILQFLDDNIFARFLYDFRIQFI